MTERSPTAAVALAVGGIVAVSCYIAAFPPVGVGNLGWDAAGSIVQMRAASLGILDLPGTRPGVGVAGAVVAGAGLAPVGTAPAVLSIAAAASLGLAAAARRPRAWALPGWGRGGGLLRVPLGGAGRGGAGRPAGLRRAWALPWWGLGVAVLLVATWGGTARLAAGYLANLLSLVLFVLGTTIAIGPAPRWWIVGAAFTAALLAHPGLLPVYGAIVLGWVVLEVLPVRFRAGRERRSLPAAAAFGVAAIAVVAIVGGVLGVSLDDLQDLAVSRERFDERAAELLTWIDPVLSVSMVALGVSVAVSWREGRRSRSAVWLGIAWLAVSAGGLALLALVPQIPGHRTLLLGVPAPALGALAIVGGARWIAGERSRARSVAAIAAAGLVAIAIVTIALRPFEVRAARPAPALGPGAGVVAGYVLAVDADRPVVVVMDPADGLELLSWKARLNAVRAAAPDAVFLAVALYVGDERELLEGRQTDRPGDARFQAVSARTWPAVDAVLDRDPIVLVVRPWVGPEAWARVAGAAPLAGPDLAVLRGPTPTSAIRPVRPVRLPAADAAARIALVLLALGSIGGGWALSASRASAAPADAIGLAPAAGLAVVTLAGLAAAIGGWDPGGGPGLLGIGAVATLGWIVARRTATAAA